MTLFVTLTSLYNILVGLPESEYNREDEKKKKELKSSDDL